MSAHGVHEFVFAATKMTGCSVARSIILLAFLGMPLSAGQQIPAEREKLGNVHFPISCGPDAQRQFDRALAMLHSFWHPQALDAFTELASTNPDCGMASWGIAVSARANPLVGPPDADALERGRLAVANAKAANVPTPRERDYIAAIDAYYHEGKNRDYPARVLAYEAAMEQVYRRYPDDSEGALFYALAINEAVTVLPADKSYARPLKAGQIIERVLAAQPDHPGALHYLIHTYDFPPLAARGLSAAQRYAQVAPSYPRSMAAGRGATASLVVRGTPTSSPFTAMHPIDCASLPAMDISRATTPARRGARRARVSRSATCAAWRSIRGNRTSSWYQRRPDRTPRTWLADRMAGCIADSLPSALRLGSERPERKPRGAGSGSAPGGQSHQHNRAAALRRRDTWRDVGRG